MSTGALFVKVCGITRLQDAELAAELGAAAVGFIFWPGSPRYIAPEAAREIVRRKGTGVKAVGVFVDEPVEDVRRIAEVAGLDLVQLHGNESGKYCREVAEAITVRLPATARGPGKADTTGIRVIKSVAMKDGGPIDLRDLDEDVLILLDAHDPERHGGTGRTIDWGAAREVAASRRTILSGGLNADNIGRAIAAVQPYGVDVSSGVESAPGVKDAVLLKGFFEALND
jgi:phosphoribosylanthranilate isomerase